MGFDWPEYMEIVEAVQVFTGEKDDPANKALGEIFGLDKPRAPMSAEKAEELRRKQEEAREIARRTLSERDMREYLASWGKFNKGYGGITKIVREEQGKGEWWEHPIGATAKQIAIRASVAPGMSKKKLENRIERFRSAAERMNALASLLEQRYEEERRPRRIQ